MTDFLAMVSTTQWRDTEQHPPHRFTVTQAGIWVFPISEIECMVSRGLQDMSVESETVKKIESESKKDKDEQHVYEFSFKESWFRFCNNI